MKTSFFLSILTAAVVAVFAFGAFSSAGAAGILRGSLDDTAKSAQLAAGQGAPISAAALVGKIVGIALVFLGVIFLILALYAGITWMVSGGKKESIKKAKDILIAASIGLAVCLMAYQVTSYIITNIIIQ